MKLEMRQMRKREQVDPERRMRVPCFWWVTAVLLLSVVTGPRTFAQDTEESAAVRARKVVESAIEAMGGEAYLNAKMVYTQGRYFSFRKGRKSFARFQDWTVYEPVLWRFQLGKGKRRLLTVYNLEIGKGWDVEGESTIEEVPEERLKAFRDGVKRDMDILFKHRLDEEGMNLYYYAPDDIAGQGDWEAVEFLDGMNNAIVVFFDLKTGLPAKVESHFTDNVGVRHKQEQEFANWHNIQGVNMPLRYDVYVDDEVSTQRFIEEAVINPEVPPDHFLEPAIKEKK
jgi:hypothetical protein